MSIEVATWITDLQPTNPPSTDPRSQGDDHLRLIKQVLQDNFPTASKAWYNPTTISKSADFTVLATDMNKTFLVDTTGALVNMTLPTLVAGDAGWECFLIKTNSGTNPVLVKPGSGTLNSGEYAALSAARRCIPGRRVQCLWTGTAWFISRNNTLPVTSMIPAQGTGLPVGYEYPNGQTLASVATNYPELNQVLGTGLLLDLRGRSEYTLDNLGGSAAGRITTSTFSPNVTSIGSICPFGDTMTLGTGNLPPYTPSGSISNGAISISSNGTGGIIAGSSNDGPFGIPASGAGISASQGGSTFSGNAQGGSSIPFPKISAAIIVNKFMIVE